jgi:hypothetical protein
VSGNNGNNGQGNGSPQPETTPPGDSGKVTDGNNSGNSGESGAAKLRKAIEKEVADAVASGVFKPEEVTGFKNEMKSIREIGKKGDINKMMAELSKLAGRCQKEMKERQGGNGEQTKESD